MKRDIGRMMMAMASASILCSQLVHAEATTIVAIQSDVSPENEQVVVLEISDAPDPILPYMPEQILDRDDPTDSQASVLFEPGMRGPLAMWTRDVGSDTFLFWSEFASGSWSVPVPVSTDLVSPGQFAADWDRDTGQLHLVYRMNQGGIPKVVHRSAPAAGLWSMARVVSQPGSDPAWPAVVFHEERLLVAYLEGESSPVVTLSEEQGEAWAHVVIGAPQFSVDGRVRLQSNGDRLWISWVDSVSELAWRRFEGTSWSSVDTEPYSDVVDREVYAPTRIRRSAMAP